MKNELGYICEKLANYNYDYTVVKAKKLVKQWLLVVVKSDESKIKNDLKEIADRLVNYNESEGFIIDGITRHPNNEFRINCHNVEDEEPLESNGDLPTPKDLQNPETCLGCHQNNSSVCDGRCFDKADDCEDGCFHKELEAVHGKED